MKVRKTLKKDKKHLFLIELKKKINPELLKTMEKLKAFNNEKKENNEKEVKEEKNKQKDHEKSLFKVLFY